MSLSVQDVAERMRFALGEVKTLPRILDPVTVCNDIGEFLVSLQEWLWLTSQTGRLSLEKNVPYIRLPAHFPESVIEGQGIADTPIRGLVGAEATDSLVDSLRLTTQAELLRMRTQNLLQNGPVYHGVVQYIPDDTANLAIQTENLAGSAWSLVNGAVVTRAQREDPFTGEMTLDKVEDTGAASARIEQVIPQHLLADGEYEASAVFAHGDTDESQLQLIGYDATGVQTITAVKVDWTATPYAVSLSGSSGASVHTFSFEYLRDACIRLTVDVNHIEKSGIDSPGLRVIIAPSTVAAVDTGFVFAGRVQVTKKVQHPHADGFPDGPAVYVPNYGDTRRVGGTPIPVISIWPVPTTTEVDKFSIEFAAGWPTVRAVTDVLAIPNWLQAWFKEAAQCWAKGLVEEDDLTLAQRLERDLVGPLDRDGRPANLLLRTAMARDSEMRRDVGPLVGGAAYAGNVYRDWGLDATVAGP